MYAPAPITSSSEAPVEQAGRAILVDCTLQPVPRGRVLLPQVDVALLRLGEAHGDKRSLEEEVRAELHHEPVLDRPGLALVGVHDDVARPGLSRDGLPLDPGREPGSAEARDPRSLELGDDPVARRELPEQVEPAACGVVVERLVRAARARSPGRRSSSA